MMTCMYPSPRRFRVAAYALRTWVVALFCAGCCFGAEYEIRGNLRHVLLCRGAPNVTNWFEFRVGVRGCAWKIDFTAQEGLFEYGTQDGGEVYEVVSRKRISDGIFSGRVSILAACLTSTRSLFTPCYGWAWHRVVFGHREFQRT